jgi:hypothetical protein
VYIAPCWFNLFWLLIQIGIWIRSGFAPPSPARLFLLSQSFATVLFQHLWKKVECAVLFFESWSCLLFPIQDLPPTSSPRFILSSNLIPDHQSHQCIVTLYILVTVSSPFPLLMYVRNKLHTIRTTCASWFLPVAVCLLAFSLKRVRFFFLLFSVLGSLYNHPSTSPRLGQHAITILRTRIAKPSAWLCSLLDYINT